MEARIQPAGKWTPLPKDFTTQIQQALKQSFMERAGRGDFFCEGRVYKREILIRMGYGERDTIKQSNFEISVAYDSAKENVSHLLNLAVDVGATMLEELFKAGNDKDFPRVWQEFEVQKKILFVQYSPVNSDLENQADEILGEEPQGLVKEDDTVEDESEQIEAYKGKLGIDDDGDGKIH